MLPQVGVDLAIEADAAAVALKSQGLGTLFQRAMAAECASFGFRLASPRTLAARLPDLLRPSGGLCYHPGDVCIPIFR